MKLKMSLCVAHAFLDFSDPIMIFEHLDDFDLIGLGSVSGRLDALHFIQEEKPHMYGVFFGVEERELDEEELALDGNEANVQGDSVVIVHEEGEGPDHVEHEESPVHHHPHLFLLLFALLVDLEERDRN